LVRGSASEGFQGRRLEGQLIEGAIQFSGWTLRQ
jgi:hypothetical protein